MINCIFEDEGKGKLRHVVLHAVVEKDGKLLLAKRAMHLTAGGQWTLPGGFLSLNETAEQGVLRELREETGWDGEIVSLFRINTNPNRLGEDRQNVALEFIVKPLSQTGEKDNESTEVEWIPIKDLENLEFAFDMKESVELYLKSKKQNG